METRLRRTVDLVLDKEARAEIVIEAMSTGTLIFARDSEALKQDYFRNWRRFDDSVGLRGTGQARIKREYAHGR
jgi:hypothetical protein